MKLKLTAGNLSILWGEQGFKATNVEGEELWFGKDISAFVPVFYNADINLNGVRFEETNTGVTIWYDQDENSPLEFVKTIWEKKGKYIQVYSQFQTRKKMCLNRVTLLPELTKMPMHKAINFRNHHCTELTYPDLAMGTEFSTTTYSSDWQFAPHPTMMLFQKNDYHLFLGALDMPTSFGLYLNMNSYQIKYFAESYGEEEQGLWIKAGEVFTGTCYALFVDYKKDPLDVVERYTSHLIEGGYIPDPSKRKYFSWHRENLYCTWIDQGYLTDTEIPNDLHNQIEITLNAGNAITEEMVRNSITIIKREKIPFRTILIDMGWSNRGEWITRPEQFQNFRKLVDDLHEEGFKVVVWWNWAEVASDVVLDSKFLMAGGRKNKHGQQMIDFSNPLTQKEYFQPLFRRLFSAEADCYNVDGVKTDFLSDKIHPDMDIYDQTWRGEERYFYKVFQLFQREMRSYKEDALHIGCAGHPYLAEFIDINRTYDVWSTNVKEHINRGKMLIACTPGTPVAYDFHHFEENLEAYFKAAYENNCSVQIGNLLGVKLHPTSGWKEVDESYYACLRLHLGKLPR